MSAMTASAEAIAKADAALSEVYLTTYTELARAAREVSRALTRADESATPALLALDVALAKVPATAGEEPYTLPAQTVQFAEPVPPAPAAPAANYIEPVAPELPPEEGEKPADDTQ